MNRERYSSHHLFSNPINSQFTPQDVYSATWATKIWSIEEYALIPNCSAKSCIETKAKAIFYQFFKIALVLIQTYSATSKFFDKASSILLQLKVDQHPSRPFRSIRWYKSILIPTPLVKRQNDNTVIHTLRLPLCTHVFKSLHHFSNGVSFKLYQFFRYRATSLMICLWQRWMPRSVGLDGVPRAASQIPLINP